MRSSRQRMIIFNIHIIFILIIIDLGIKLSPSFASSTIFMAGKGIYLDRQNLPNWFFKNFTKFEKWWICWGLPLSGRNERGYSRTVLYFSSLHLKFVLYVCKKIIEKSFYLLYYIINKAFCQQSKNTEDKNKYEAWYGWKWCDSFWPYYWWV